MRKGRDKVIARRWLNPSPHWVPVKRSLCPESMGSEASQETLTARGWWSSEHVEAMDPFISSRRQLRKLDGPVLSAFTYICHKNPLKFKMYLPFIVCAFVFGLHVCLCDLGVTNTCELPCGWRDLNPAPSEAYAVPLTAEPSLQPPQILFFCL